MALALRVAEKVAGFSFTGRTLLPDDIRPIIVRVSSAQ